MLVVTSSISFSSRLNLNVKLNRMSITHLSKYTNAALSARQIVNLGAPILQNVVVVRVQSFADGGPKSRPAFNLHPTTMLQVS